MDKVIYLITNLGGFEALYVASVQDDQLLYVAGIVLEYLYFLLLIVTSIDSIIKPPLYFIQVYHILSE